MIISRVVTDLSCGWPVAQWVQQVVQRVRGRRHALRRDARSFNSFEREIMVTVGLVVKLTAKPDTQDEVADFLAGALPLANDEPGTEVWMALRTDESTFWIVDAFPGPKERQAHLDGPIADALLANADRLFSSPPELNQAEVLAIK
jgi:quinol monooxygenase YgiN